VRVSEDFRGRSGLGGYLGGPWCTRFTAKPVFTTILFGIGQMSAGAAKLSGMKGELPPTLGYLAGNQSGVVSRSQALRAGLTVDTIKFRVRSGRWRQIHPGVYATFTGMPGRSARLWAAVLSAGPGAVLSYQTAAELQGLADKPDDSIHVTVPRERHGPFTRPGGRRGRRDRVYEPFGLVIELDGQLAHQPEDRWRDKTRDNAAAADGKQTLRYGWSQVKWEPCATAAEVARVLRRRGWGGRPRPCSPGCPVQRDLPG
jgi:hypothetical protein